MADIWNMTFHTWLTLQCHYLAHKGLLLAYFHFEDIAYTYLYVYALLEQRKTQNG